MTPPLLTSLLYIMNAVQTFLVAVGLLSLGIRHSVYQCVKLSMCMC